MTCSKKSQRYFSSSWQSLLGPVAITKIVLKLMKQNGCIYMTCTADYGRDKWQARPVVTEGAPHRQNHNCRTVTEISSWALQGAVAPRLTGRLTVDSNVILTSEPVSDRHELVTSQSPSSKDVGMEAEEYPLFGAVTRPTTGKAI
jgi:hypothetical protein